MGSVAKMTDRTMPITSKRIPLIAAALALVLLATPALAAGKFTVVIGGKITSVETVDGPGGKMVHAKAVAEMARASGYGLSLDAGSGILSLTRGGGEVDDAFRGFKSGVTFVVDGKIVKVASKAAGGAPYVGSKDLKKVAELLGFEADLEGTVLGLTLSAGASTPAVATGVPGSGIGGDFMNIVQGAAGGTGLAGGSSPYNAPAHDGSVCGYMDSQRVLWTSTEPNVFEKETFQRLADLWSKKDGPAGNPADLQLFEKTLKGFHQKAQARLKGTKESMPPLPARPWYDASVTYLVKVDDILKLTFDMIRVMKLPEEKQKAEFEQLKKNMERIKRMDVEQKALGTTQVDETYGVRERNGCSPP
jgi:hypothetical protein